MRHMTLTAKIMCSKISIVLFHPTVYELNITCYDHVSNTGSVLNILTAELPFPRFDFRRPIFGAILWSILWLEY